MTSKLAASRNVSKDDARGTSKVVAKRPLEQFGVYFMARGKRGPKYEIFEKPFQAVQVLDEGVKQLERMGELASEIHLREPFISLDLTAGYCHVHLHSLM